MEKTNNKPSLYKYELKPEIHIPSGTCNYSKAFIRKGYLDDRYKKQLEQHFNPVTLVQKCCTICNIT